MFRKTALAIVAAGALALPAAAEGIVASAAMKGIDGKDLGSVSFEETASGMLEVDLELKGLAPGAHAFHVHETGKCDAADGFKSAGGHYAGGMKHGVETEGGPHAGDFPNITAGDDGTVRVTFFTDRLSLGEGGKNPLRDADGSAVVIHDGTDDYKSQPAGDAGSRIACGVIE